MKEVSQKLKECDDRHVHLKPYLMTLNPDAWRNAHKKNSTVVQKAGELRATRQELLSKITKLEDDKLEVNE